MIKMIISPEYFGVNEKESAIKEQVRKWGAKNINIDEDTGYISAIMSANDYYDFVVALRKSVVDKIDEIISDKTKYPSVVDIKYSGDMSCFDVRCIDNIDKEKRDIALELYMVSTSYQVLSGIPQELTYVSVLFTDSITGNVLGIIDTSEIIGN